MNSPIQNINRTIFDAVSLSAQQTSHYINIRDIVGYAVHFSWANGSGTIGTLIVEATNDNLEDAYLITPVYSIIASAAVTTNSGDWLLNVERAMYSYIRLRWVPSAGTGGTLTAKTSSKRN